MPEENGNAKLMELIKKYIDKTNKKIFDSLNRRFDSMQGNFTSQSERIDANHAEIIVLDIELNQKIDSGFKEVKKDIQGVKEDLTGIKTDIKEIKDLIKGSNREGP